MTAPLWPVLTATEVANGISFRMNPEWVEIVETETSEEKQVQRKPRTPKKETVE